MKKRLTLALLTLLLSSTATAIYEEDGWHFTTFMGASTSAPNTLRVYTDDAANHSQKAKWQGRAFEDSFYYAIRFDKVTNQTGWGIEWVHHKIYLANPQGPIDAFSISDGFNILYLNRVRAFDNHAYRYGAGLVFAHMDVTLDGRERFYVDGGIGGAYLSGISAQVAVEKWLWKNDTHFVNFETKFTASYLRPPVSLDQSEFATLNNFALHFNVGLGTKPMTNKGDLKAKAKHYGPSVLYHAFAQYANF